MNERIYYSRDAEIRAQRDRIILAIVIAGLGVGIGSIVALLLAPRSGEKTRHQVADTLNQAAGQGREVAGQVMKSVREGAGRLQEEVSERLQKTS